MQLKYHKKHYRSAQIQFSCTQCFFTICLVRKHLKSGPQHIFAFYSRSSEVVQQFRLYQLLLLWCFFVIDFGAQLSGCFSAFLQRRRKVQIWNDLRVKKVNQSKKTKNNKRATKSTYLLCTPKKKKQHAYVIACQCMTCLRAFKDKTGFYLYCKPVMSTEAAQKQSEPLSGALYREL